MKYVGNSPGMIQVPSPFETQEPANPTVDVNPDEYPKSWLNVVTRERFACIDNTWDANVWVGNQGTII